MPITLAQAKVGMANKVDQAVIDQFRRDSFILDQLTFDNAVSPGTGGSTLTYGYVQLLTPSVANGRAINADYQPGEAIKTPKTADLKIFGGSFEVDRVLEDTSAKSEIAFQLQQKTKATKNKFHYDFINGDKTAHATEFDGLDVLVTGSATEVIPANAIAVDNLANIKANGEALVFELHEMIRKMAEKPDALLMNGRALSVLRMVAMEMGYYTRGEDAFGRGVDNFDGIPMIDMGEYYDAAQAKTVDVIGIGAGTGETSIYAVKFGLDALHGVSPTGNKIVKTYLPDMKAPGAVKKGEVEMVACIVLKNSKMASVLRKVKVQ